MGTDLAGRRLLIAGGRTTAAAVAGEASRCGAVVTLATDARGEGEGPAEGHAIRYDGASEGDIERAMDVALERASGLDGVIVAVETEAMPPLDEQPHQAWEQCVMQPLRTAFWLVRRSVLDLLAAGRGGQIAIVIARGHGESAAGSAAIVESALASLGRSIAKEYGRRAITCNVAAGGSTPGELRAAVEAVLFFASPAAGFVTGECLRVSADSMAGE